MTATELLRAVLACSCVIIAAADAKAQDTKLSTRSEVPVQIFPAGIYPLSPEREQALKPKDSFKECDVCPEMVVVPKGSFTMGTPVNEPDRDKGEDPIHRVTIAQSFAVGRSR